MVFQLGSALLDACVLGALLGGERYGYDLSREVMTVIDISESTLYPVLRRLKNEGCLITYDRNVSGRNRRYYLITPKGRERAEKYRTEWEKFKCSVDALLGGGEK